MIEVLLTPEQHASWRMYDAALWSGAALGDFLMSFHAHTASCGLRVLREVA